MTELQQPARGISILRLKHVMERTGLSRSTIYDRMDTHSPRHDPNFPCQVQLGDNAVGWVSSEIDAWLAARIQAKRPADGKKKSQPPTESKPAPFTETEKVTVNGEADQVKLLEKQVDTVSLFLAEKIKAGNPRVTYPEVMGSIHLWEDKPEDRLTIDRVLTIVTRNSHKSNGILLGVLVHGSAAHDSKTVDSFFDLARSLGYAVTDPAMFVKEQTERVYDFYDSEANRAKGRILWLSGNGGAKLFLIREKAILR